MGCTISQCLHCHRPGRKIIGRGLCQKCHRKPALRSQYARLRSELTTWKKPGTCVCCEAFRRHLFGHGLCEICYRDLETRELYKNGGTEYEPTDEELNTIIAEQSERLPEWWEHDERAEQERARREREEYFLVRLMRR